MQNQPLVTVYIPTFNRVELLKRAVKSVQDQTYKNLEIIIVDDCSTDGTHEYLEQVSKEDKRVRFFLKEINSGACVSRNIAIENAKGEFITGLDDDDYFLKNRVEIFLDSWLENISCLYSNLLIKYDNERYKTNYRLALKNKVVQKNLLNINHIGNQVFTKTIFLKEIGGFDPNMQVWQDLECWYRLTKNKPAIRVNKELYVVDMSHPHERISHGKSTKVIASFEYFSKKHNLNLFEKKILSTQMINYKGINLPKKTYWLRFFKYPTLGTFRDLINKILSE